MIEVLTQIISEFWFVLSEMAPYLLFGFFVAGLLSVVISAETVERHLGGRGIWPVIKATVFGIPLPLCSCGVIPVAASLRRHGANRGATTAFLLSTPQTGVDSVMVTFSLLGPIFAIFRPLAAFFTGLLGGSLVGLAEGDGANQEAPAGCTDDCCSTEPRGNRLTRLLRYGFVTLPRDIGKALLIGLLIAGLISALIPDDYLAGVLGAGIGAMIVMMLLGIPVYVCATASVPVAAALIAKGVSPGAALVFLMTGPATNAAAITTIWKIMGKRTAIVYLLTVAITALAFGLFLDYIFQIQGTTAAASMSGMLPGLVKTGSAIVLLALLGAAIWRPSRQPGSAGDNGPAAHVVTLSVSGMTCDHCAQSVRRALTEVAGVRSVDVDLKAGKVRAAGENLNTADLQRGVERLGYKVDRIEENK
jgi:uncharacterized membrane protein YraQ (UPF0718 family)/copper chaperone CopZ